MLIVILWAFAEATLFFIVADVPISAIGLRSGWQPAAKAAVAASLAAACGGVVVQHWAAADTQTYRALLIRIPGIGSHLIDRASSAYAGGDTLAMMWGSFSGTPYKLYAFAAAGRAVFPFFLASVIARFPRFLLVAGASSAIGKILQPRLKPWQVHLLFSAFWVLFYAAYFHLMSGND